VSPLALPALAESAARPPGDRHDTRTPAGRPVTLKGRVTRVAVTRSGGGPADTYVAPFRATVEGSALRIGDGAHEQSYPFEALGGVTVHCDDRRPGSALGSGLVIAGAVTLGASWGASTFWALIAGGSGSSPTPEGASRARILLAPLAGPFVALGAWPDGAGRMAPWLVLDGLLQTGGAAMLVAGIALSAKPPAGSTSARGSVLWPMPMTFGPGSFGLGVAGQL
jgi:hypothetical protein